MKPKKSTSELRERVNFSVDSELMRRLRSFSKASNIPMSRIMDEVLIKFLEMNENQEEKDKTDLLFSGFVATLSLMIASASLSPEMRKQMMLVIKSCILAAKDAGIEMETFSDTIIAIAENASLSTIVDEIHSELDLEWEKQRK